MSEILNLLSVALSSSLSEMSNDYMVFTYFTENEQPPIENFRGLSDKNADALPNMNDVMIKYSKAPAKRCSSLFYPYRTNKSSVQFLEIHLSCH